MRVTQAAGVERGAQEDLEFLSMLLANVTDSVFVYLLDEPKRGRIVYANRAACESRGMTKDELLAMNAIDLIAPDYRHKMAGWLRDLERYGETSIESVHIRKDGSRFPVEVRLRTLTYRDERVVVNVSRDITRRRVEAQRLSQRAERLEVLRVLAETASVALEPSELGWRQLATLRAPLELSSAIILSVSENGDRLAPLAAIGFPSGHLERFGTVSVEGDSLAARVFRTGTRLLAADLQATDDLSEFTRVAADACQMARAAVLPVSAAGEAIGVLFLAWKRASPFDQEEIPFLDSVASGVALGLANSRLFAEERERTRLAAALGRIVQSVHSSLEVAAVVQGALSEGAAAIAAESAAMDGIEGDKWVVWYDWGWEQSVVGHVYTNEQNPHGVLSARTGQTIAVDDAFNDPRVDAETMKAYGLHSAIVAPLVVRGSAIACLYYNYHSGRHHFTPAEIDFVSKVASSLSLAIENARLYAEERDIADRLQEALLQLPDALPGIDFAHAYHSAAEAARVGGDFYDLFQIGEDMIGITIGDVAGKGLDAAVLTSLVKNTIRAHAMDTEVTPPRVLERTNEVVYKSTPSQSFVTVFFGVLDLRDGHFVYSNGGHTTPAVVSATGAVRGLPPTGPLVGALQNAEFTCGQTTLELDEALFMYTDGLTEARRDNDFFGEERVFELLGRSKTADAAELARNAVEAALEYTGGALSDDLALLALRRLPESERHAGHEELAL